MFLIVATFMTFPRQNSFYKKILKLDATKRYYYS